MKGPARVRSWLGGAVYDNFWLKMIALVTALGFYAFIHSAKPLTEKFEVRMKWEDPDSSTGRARKTDLPDFIFVEVRGPAQVVQQINQRELSVVLNLVGGQDEDVDLTREMINGLPPGVDVTRFSPPVLEIRFEDIISREVPVQVARVGEPSKDMEVKGTIAVDPEHVLATGIRTLVDAVQFARADAFDVTDLDEGRHTRTLRLDRPPLGVSYDSENVTARIDIARQLAVKEFDQVAVEIIGMPRAKTRPGTVHVIITGTPAAVAKIDASQIVPQVDVSKGGIDLSQPGSANFPVIVDIPDVQVDVNPTKVLVKW